MSLKTEFVLLTRQNRLYKFPVVNVLGSRFGAIRAVLGICEGAIVVRGEQVHCAWEQTIYHAFCENKSRKTSETLSIDFEGVEICHIRDWITSGKDNAEQKLRKFDPILIQGFTEE